MNKPKQPKPPLILEFKSSKINFATVKHGELLEKLFKYKPVPYLATLLYFELFNIAYDNFIQRQDESFSFLISYKELKEKFKDHNYQTCTISNALRNLEEAKLIIKDRIMVNNNEPDSRFKRKLVLSITIKLSANMQKSLQIKPEQS